MTIPYDDALEVHQQAEGFTDHAMWPFDECPPASYPLLLHFPYFDLYRKQVVKQADLVLALYECGYAFTDQEKARDFSYYERLCVRDSSLSASSQAIVAAEVGHLELAYDYFAEAALMDLDDLEHNTRDGIHIASVAGTWIAAVAGFGGMRDHFGKLTFRPRLPGALTKMRFRMMVRGRRLVVEVDQQHARYRLRSGEPLDIEHHGEPITVTTGDQVEMRIPKIKPRGRPQQPPGRAPARRRPSAN